VGIFMEFNILNLAALREEKFKNHRDFVLSISNQYFRDNNFLRGGDTFVLYLDYIGSIRIEFSDKGISLRLSNRTDRNKRECFFTYEEAFLEGKLTNEVLREIANYFEVIYFYQGLRELIADIYVNSVDYQIWTYCINWLQEAGFSRLLGGSNSEKTYLYTDDYDEFKFLFRFTKSYYLFGVSFLGNTEREVLNEYNGHEIHIEMVSQYPKYQKDFPNEEIKTLIQDVFLNQEVSL